MKTSNGSSGNNRFEDARRSVASGLDSTFKAIGRYRLRRVALALAVCATGFLFLLICSPLTFSASLAQSATATPEVSAAATPTATAMEGRIVTDTVHCASLEGNLLGDSADRRVLVYLPPSYDKFADGRYPVVYLLQAYGSSPDNFTATADPFDPFYQNFDIQATMNELVAMGEAREMIFVMADATNKYGGGWYLNSKVIGDYESCFTQELVKYIDGKYRTIAQRDSRALVGQSMGGYGAMHLGLKYPDRFGTVIAMSGAYDASSWQGFLQAAALANPKDFDELAKAPFEAQAGYSLAAAISPNPNNPPFYVDLPYKVVDGKAEVVPEIWDLYVKADIVHGHVGTYLQQGEMLNGIMIVHGTGDQIAPVKQAREVDEEMTALGIKHTYWEHQVSEPMGGHVFLGHYPQRWLQFLSETLRP